MINSGQNITTQISSSNLMRKLSSLKSYLLSFLGNFRTKLSELYSSKITDSSNRPQENKKRNFKKYLPWAIIGVFVIVTLAGIVSLLNRPSSSKIQVKGAKASQGVNKEFLFPLKDSKGEEVSKIKFVIENAELRDEIVVKGQRATSVSGRTFLILNLKISNEHNQAIEINTRDYIRLTKNENKDELLAPDIHNDPAEIQAISTKLTRVGFAINDSDRDLVLRIGEINGEKQEIELFVK